MKAREIRQQFLDYFESKDHRIVDSAPIVSKDDPTLMFTNAGMNQFKDYFLGNAEPTHRRVADTQKCLRVSGKHNDLEEVGVDSYHHTMFEMLGNWSFGDYFKKEAIQWAWELLTDTLGIDADRLYVTVFGGDVDDGLEKDDEAFEFWKQWVSEDRILFFDKKDNFWEMGDTGPCGPCSEIHVDLRPSDQQQVPAQQLVNKDDPNVIELWNLVFIQFDRKADGRLQELPEKHVDTGMGFERLCMVLQGKKSNYETDVFRCFIQQIEAKTGIVYTNKYDGSSKTDMAMRVLVDHIRAVSFTIADGELPSNTGAGYVIRRILRRAVRYYFSFLDIKSPFLHELVGPLADHFQGVFAELEAQKDFVAKVVLEEERSFLRTLEGGLKRLDQLNLEHGTIDGNVAFELYDTYGFPIDLTRLIARERGVEVDEVGFEKALEEQKARSRADAQKITGDWTNLYEAKDVRFDGYDDSTMEGARVVKYRKVVVKDKTQYHVVLDKTVFYPEGGGQVGDRGFLFFGDEGIRVLDTKRENELIIHYVDRLPELINVSVRGTLNTQQRRLTENNHTATHLLHAALRHVLGDHVQQKGSLVSHTHLRFDFAHFQKMSAEELAEVESMVNRKIRDNVAREERREIPIREAQAAGAMMLFGEKYGDTVRMITFDPNYSIELCGGCHVDATGEIGLFKITSESAIAAGVRRIEAVTAEAADEHVNHQLEELNAIRGLFKSPVNTVKNVFHLQEENKTLRREIEALRQKQANDLQGHLESHFELVNGIHFLAETLPINDAKAAKNMAYSLEKKVGNAFILFGMEDGQKAQLMLTISEGLTKDGNLNAGQIIRELAKEIHGGGGGQAFFATAGGKNVAGLPVALKKARKFL